MEMEIKTPVAGRIAYRAKAGDHVKVHAVLAEVKGS
jgi:biotin carboxyl carrier protein